MFTAGYFPREYRKALARMGRVQAGTRRRRILLPLPLARALPNGYSFAKDGLAREGKDYYVSCPGAFPLEGIGEWNPHWLFAEDIVDVKENEEQPHGKDGEVWENKYDDCIMIMEKALTCWRMKNG